ncbi:MAG: amidoligase family protein, partial [Planctomycetota bacterium]|nr:amidoligase family protein [Planctomycetota bacterium]
MRNISIKILVLLSLFGSVASAQERAVSPPEASKNSRLFGAEFEFAGQGNRAALWENQSYENYRKVMEVIAKHYGGGANDVKKIVWNVPHPSGEGERTLYRAEYTDPRGRTWKVEPEYVDTRSLDGYELVTPPLEDPRESTRVLEKLKSSGLLREGVKSGAHIHIDGRDLITPRGNATALINTITMHETFEPLLRTLFNPVRGSGLFNHNRSDAVTNRFARSFALDHPGLLEKISQLPPEKRTQAEIEKLFSRATAAEMKAHNINELSSKSWKTMWKYRSLNLINVININEALPASKGTVEFRMNDLPFSDPKLHLLEVQLYQALVERAKSLAEAGKVFEFKAPTQAPRSGEDPVRSRTPRNPNEARNQLTEMIEFLNLDPAEYKPLIDRNIKRSGLPSEEVLEKRLASKNTPTINGSKVSYELSVDGKKTSFNSLEAAQEALARVSGDPSAKNKDIRLTLEAKPGRAYMAKHATALAEFIARADAFSRLNAVEAGAPAKTGYSSAEVSKLASRLKNGSLEGNTGSGRSVNLQSSQGDVLRVEIAGQGSQGKSISQVTTLVGEQLRRGAFGPWAGANAGNEARNTGKAGNAVDFVKNAETYLKTVEGKSLEAHQRSFLEGLQKRGKIASTLSLPLLDFHEAKHLPRRVTRDLGFRQQEYIRNLLEIADAVKEGKYGEANNVNRGAVDRDARAIVQRWAKETKLARYTLRSLVGESKDARKVVATPSRISRAEIYKSFSTVKQANGEPFKLEVVDAKERFIKPGEAKTLKISTALINEVHNKSLTLEPSKRAEYRSKALSTLFETEIKRATLPRTSTGEIDKLAKYRRGDGTLRWKALTADKALQHGAGVAHFALALFLKEMAVVVKTGDKARIEEFFEGLATTDFFVVY